MPGAFNMDHVQPITPIWFQKIFNFFTFILGGQFLLPQRANMHKREFSQLQNWMRQRVRRKAVICGGPFRRRSHFWGSRRSQKKQEPQEAITGQLTRSPTLSSSPNPSRQLPAKVLSSVPSIDDVRMWSGYPN